MTKILVIEDEASLLEGILTMLSFESFEAIGATDGTTGVRLALEYLPDLIISDIMMPGLDGYGVLLALQDDPATAGLPFVFLTAKSEREHIRYGMELGADDYVIKPFTRDELLAAIRTRLAKQVVIKQEYGKRLDDLRQTVTLVLPHELRTPLTSLVGYAELLMTDSEVLTPDQVIQMADALLKAGKRLRRQLENFLVYAQLEAIKLDSEWIAALRGERTPDPATIIEHTAHVQAAERDRIGDLEVNAQNAVVRADGEFLRKIVGELADNAFKFSRPGTPVKITGSARDDVYQVLINDQGRGMTPEQIRNTEAYIQFERKFYEQQGTGLGLVIARRMVDLQGGYLTIESMPAQGTQVLIKLPLGSASD
ncbi:MAG TPA: ATP-binding protein [Aggregatilineaceae bacterium]|nr:ATP-binding protein [Aggregatilineaceae bacterium]